MNEPFSLQKKITFMYTLSKKQKTNKVVPFMVRVSCSHDSDQLFERASRVTLLTSNFKLQNTFMSIQCTLCGVHALKTFVRNWKRGRYILESWDRLHGIYYERSVFVKSIISIIDPLLIFPRTKYVNRMNWNMTSINVGSHQSFHVDLLFFSCLQSSCFSFQ